MERIVIGASSEAIVSRGIARSNEVLPPRQDRLRVAVLTQPGAESIARDLSGNLRVEEVFVRVLPDREAAKTLEVAADTYRWLAEIGLSRHDTIVGVGGGAATDLAGFVAATYLRGVEVVHVPTTLLGAVDAAVGGKSGVNLDGKNLVGAFWHPSRVSIDLDVLEALPVDLRREGLAEALKAGLVGDRTLFETLEAHGLDVPLESVVARAVAVKASVVERDFREGGERAVLNFGHTVGHAVEVVAGVSHGEAVALGILAAGRVSEIVCGFAESARVQRVIERLGFPSTVSGLRRGEVLRLLAKDKKRDVAGLRMVLLRGIADPEVRHVHGRDVEAGLRAVGIS